MCFSATASFTAGAVLLGVGTLTLRAALTSRHTHRRNDLPFAAIPLLFAVQQLIEGVIWLTFRVDAPLLNSVMTHLYSFFSHVLWPVYVPMAVLLMEPAGWRRRGLIALVAAGAAVGAYLLVVLVAFPIISRPTGQHIEYVSPHFFAASTMTLYLLSTAVSPLLSTHRMVVAFGALALLSFGAAYAFYTRWFISVWCFFAALLSAVIYLHFSLRGREPPRPHRGPNTARNPTLDLTTFFGERNMRKSLAGLTAALALSLPGCGYNTFQTTDEQVKAGWAEVISQYQRRADLIPNLVNTVKGEAKFEQETLTKVIEARSKATSIQATPELINDPAAFQKFQQAQGELTGALSRLMVVSEQYPNLRSNQGFRDLSAQLEGTENRITVARNRYIKTVQDYNVTVRSFPSNLTALVFGYKEKPTFAVENEKEIAKPPSVGFDTAPAKAAGPGSGASK